MLGLRCGMSMKMLKDHWGILYQNDRLLTLNITMQFVWGVVVVFNLLNR